MCPLKLFIEENAGLQNLFHAGKHAEMNLCDEYATFHTFSLRAHQSVEKMLEPKRTRRKMTYLYDGLGDLQEYILLRCVCVEDVIEPEFVLLTRVVDDLCDYCGNR